MTSGEQLVELFGLSKFPNIYIQRLISSKPIFIVSVDSRYPGIHISYNELVHTKFASIQQVDVRRDGYDFDNLRLTPPIPLRGFSGLIANDALVFIRDFAGEYLRNDKMFESSTNNLIGFKLKNGWQRQTTKTI